MCVIARVCVLLKAPRSRSRSRLALVTPRDGVRGRGSPIDRVGEDTATRTGTRAMGLCGVRDRVRVSTVPPRESRSAYWATQIAIIDKRTPPTDLAAGGRFVTINTLTRGAERREEAGGAPDPSNPSKNEENRN